MRRLIRTFWCQLFHRRRWSWYEGMDLPGTYYCCVVCERQWVRPDPEEGKR